MPRIVAAEALDHLAPDDPVARRSRRDLVRVHLAMGTRSIVSRGWRSLLTPAMTRRPLRILELGAGDGTLLLGVARSLVPRWPQVQLTLLDRQHIVSTATQQAYADLGWTAQVQVDEVLAWAARPAQQPPGACMEPWDLITTTLFLHHFEARQIGLVLAAVASHTDRFFACEPKRSWLPLAGGHLIGAIGANAVTRADAVLSVHAGFRGQEITAAWPPAEGIWQTREASAGLFSHCFSAIRSGIA